MAVYFDKQGKQVDLTKELAQGGEGAVYEIANRADIVAKLYHKPLALDKAEKISVMASFASDRLSHIAAWPISTVHQKPGAPVCGFLMPKASGHPIHELYGPKSRLTQFPDATWPFLVHTAMNAARAFAVIHEQGYVVGDVNQSSFYVSDKSTVKLIDCDSFQIVQNGHAYLCEVGVPTHTPPELQGKPFHGVTRSPNHDNFGLAIVIFQLLFMARHPFAGQYLGPGDMSIPQAISEFRFAYGPGAASRQMKPPPASATLPFSAIPDQVALLFEQAFNPSGAKPGGRPRAQDWVSVLSNIARGTRICSRNTGHQYYNALSQCPWCEIENKSGVIFFNAIVVGTKQSTAYDTEAVWVQILAVPHPGPLPTLSILAAFSPPPMLTFALLPPLVEPSARVALSTRMQNISQKRTARRWLVASIVAVVGLFSSSTGNPLAIFYLMLMAFVVSYTLIILLFNRGVQSQIDELMQAAVEEYQFAVANREVEEQEQLKRERKYQEKRKNIEQSLSLAETQYTSIRQQWENEASSQAFDARIAELKEAKKQLQDLNQTLQQRLLKLETEGAKRQLEKYLDKFKLQSASIDGIGQGRKATLQSYGVETAADISESFIQSIPGFGQSLCGALMAWRRMHEQKFIYNPNLGVDPADKVALEQQFTPRRLKLEQELSNGAVSLQMIRQQIFDKRGLLRPKLEKTTQLVTSGRSDLMALTL